MYLYYSGGVKQIFLIVQESDCLKILFDFGIKLINLSLIFLGISRKFM